MPEFTPSANREVRSRVCVGCGAKLATWQPHYHRLCATCNRYGLFKRAALGMRAVRS